MNLQKIDFALKNGTDDQRREVLDGIKKINLISEKVWHGTQTKQVSFVNTTQISLSICTFCSHTLFGEI